MSIMLPLIFLLVCVSWCSFADDFPVTLNLKDQKIVLQSNFTWAYVPKVKPPPPVLFKDLPFGTSFNQFQKIFASKKEVMKSWPQEGVYYFEESFANEPATLFFYFKQDAFYHGEAVFKITSTTNTPYMESYARIRSVLSKLYGVPTTSKRTFSEWILGDHIIRLVLAEQNKKLYLGAVFHHNETIKPPSSENIAPTQSRKTMPTRNAEVTHPSQNIIPAPPVPPDKKKLQLQELQNLIETL